MSHRNLKYLNDNRIVYRRLPIKDKPDQENEVYLFYLNGTHECYELFRSSAKITTYKSLKWHLLVLWYLNPDLDQDKFMRLAEIICYKKNGFITFNCHENLIEKIIDEVNEVDLDEPPRNKLRKIIFRDNSGLTIKQKQKIIGSLIGRNKKAEAGDIYETMLLINEQKNKITIRKIAAILDVSTRTIYRHMNKNLAEEKKLLNEEI